MFIDELLEEAKGRKQKPCKEPDLIADSFRSPSVDSTEVGDASGDTIRGGGRGERGSRERESDRSDGAWSRPRPICPRGET
ncbi:hypothetical protein QR680_001061 [Steinernema hermaphroditum]|uniref:Uncharacterized protein n=1 Tax=Steinernema hermaphroditum TaxID=289476 RepID=A0AA39GWU2_9BILA|nr:hypothetical protein QR680_001061 [Steinernema hermaphroditum]